MFPCMEQSEVAQFPCENKAPLLLFIKLCHVNALDRCFIAVEVIDGDTFFDFFHKVRLRGWLKLFDHWLKQLLIRYPVFYSEHLLRSFQCVHGAGAKELIQQFWMR